VIDTFLGKLEAFYKIVSLNPHLFRYYDKRRNIRMYALTKQNSIYYRNKRAAIEIITVFDTRQNPQKLKKIARKS
jgi:plasmid stabilization system protein ParE